MELDKEKAALVLPFPEDCLVELGRLSVAFSYLASVLDLAVWILIDAEARKLRRDRDTCVKMQSQEHSAASILAIVSETYEAAQAIDGMLLCLSGLNTGGSRS